MLSPQFRRTNILPIALIALSAAAIGYWSAQAGALAAPAKDTKLNNLLQERLTTLKDAAATTSKAFETGIESLDDVIAANQAVRRAELEMCSTDKERVALLEKMVTEAKGYETIAAQHALRGVAPTASSLRVKVNEPLVHIPPQRGSSRGRTHSNVLCPCR